MSKGTGTTIHGVDKVGFSTVNDGSFTYICFSTGDSDFTLIIRDVDHAAKAEALAFAFGGTFGLEVKNHNI